MYAASFALSYFDAIKMAHPSEGYAGGFPGISPLSNGSLWEQKPAVKVKMPGEAIQALGRCSLTIDILAACAKPQRLGDKGAAGPRGTSVHQGLFFEQSLDTGAKPKTPRS
jgi:hypothetical protein